MYESREVAILHGGRVSTSLGVLIATLESVIRRVEEYTLLALIVVLPVQREM